MFHQLVMQFFQKDDHRLIDAPPEFPAACDATASPQQKHNTCSPRNGMNPVYEQTFVAAICFPHPSPSAVALHRCTHSTVNREANAHEAPLVTVCQVEASERGLLQNPALGYHARKRAIASQDVKLRQT